MDPGPPGAVDLTDPAPAGGLEESRNLAACAVVGGGVVAADEVGETIEDVVVKLDADVVAVVLPCRRSLWSAFFVVEGQVDRDWSGRVPQDGSAAGAEIRLTSVVVDFGLEATFAPLRRWRQQRDPPLTAGTLLLAAPPSEVPGPTDSPGPTLHPSGASQQDRC